MRVVQTMLYAPYSRKSSDSGTVKNCLTQSLGHVWVRQDILVHTTSCKVYLRQNISLYVQFYTGEKTVTAHSTIARYHTTTTRCSSSSWPQHSSISPVVTVWDSPSTYLNTEKSSTRGLTTTQSPWLRIQRKKSLELRDLIFSPAITTWLIGKMF